ncbi:MAG: gamma-glutamyltransferase, partial [Acidobacteria bacterium]|nr:gamma-glutamyltransferase [Acidobacteriota bacterium]
MRCSRTSMPRRITRGKMPRSMNASLRMAILGIALQGCTAAPDLPPITSIDTTESYSTHGVVATGFPEATEAGVLVLEDGGNAIDAAVAAAFVSFSSAPGSCGLFGSTYVLIHLADGHDIAIDGSARVPLEFSTDELAELRAEDRLYGVKVAAAPGSLAALDHALARYGTRPLAEIIEPAIGLAERGLLVTSSKRAAINKYADTIREGENLRQLLLIDGDEVPEVGTVIRQTDLAQTMRRIATYGAEDFYRGGIAQVIDADMKRRGGYISRGDLGIYRAKEHRPLHGTYRGTEIISYPWPGAGGAVIEALNILEHYPSEWLRQSQTNQLQAYVEAFHISSRDHERFTNPSSISGRPPDTIYTSKVFAAERAELVEFENALSDEILGNETGFYTPPGGTTQISVADRFGNVVSLTQTMGRFFGARAMAPGVGIVYNSFL